MEETQAVVEAVVEAQSTEQEVAPEAVVAEVAKEKEVDRSGLVKQWSLIQKQDKAMRQREASLVAKEKELQSLQERLNDLSSFKEDFAKDPIQFLDKHAGKDWYDKATQRFLKDPSGKVPVEDEVAALKAELQKEREGRDTWLQEKIKAMREEEQKASAEKEAVTTYVNQIKTLRDTSEDYELCRLNGLSENEAIEAAKLNYQKTGELLTAEQLLTKFEKYFEKKLEDLGKAKKAQNIFSSKNAQAAEKTPKASSGKTVIKDQLKVGTPVASEEVDLETQMLLEFRKAKLGQQ